ncbi:MAG: polyphosphate kinase 2 family protein [Chthoniobacterales bacterium]
MSHRIADLAERYRFDGRKKFRLKDHNPGDTGGLDSKENANDRLAEGVTALCELQERLFAQSEWSVLLIFQAMDAAGKDATIKHVLSGVNPQGCSVSSFKAPSKEELAHDFLWRGSGALPERGRIGIFNRSYYEEVLIVRVHPEYLDNQKLPRKLVTKKIWKERFQSINDFERHLSRNGTLILKFFLHVSVEEQRKRLLERLDEKEKHFKFEPNDLKERKLWDRYMDAYQGMVRQTATKYAPWYVVPADHKWFTRLVVSSIIIDRMRALRLHYPPLTAEDKKAVAAARLELSPGS